MNNIPEMTVEFRESTESHGIKPPTDDKQNLVDQINDALILNEDAKKGLIVVDHLMAKLRKEVEHLNWLPSTLDILKNNFKVEFDMDVTDEEIKMSVKDVFGMDGFHDVVRWVQHDHCTEVYVKMMRYCEREGQKEVKNVDENDFIDSDGVGYMMRYLRKLGPALQKTFDVKYFFKSKRIIHQVFDWCGVNLSGVANKINPRHWSHIQGHFTKSIVAYFDVRKRYVLDKHCDRMLLIAAIIFGYGRDGNLIHKREDTQIGDYMK